MAIEERKTKAERRAEARAERKAQAEQEAKQDRRRRIISFASTAGVLIVIGLVLIPTVQRLFGGDEVEDLEITAAGAEQSREAADCEVLVEDAPLPDRNHLDPAEAPPADILYANAEVRPTSSGSHFQTVSPPIANVPRTPIEERSIVHNLEHGAIAVWFDPEALDPDSINAIGDWGEQRIDLGFQSRAGANVFTSPYDGEITSGKPIALRAWGQAMDCDSWDPTVGDAFVIDYFGTHGIAPERNLSPYPDGALGYGDRETGDTQEGEGPQDNEPERTEDPSEMAPTETGSDAPTTEEATAEDGVSTEEEPTTDGSGSATESATDR